MPSKKKKKVVLLELFHLIVSKLQNSLYFIGICFAIDQHELVHNCKSNGERYMAFNIFINKKL